MSRNVCFNDRKSCSACCGLHNISLPDPEKKNWLEKNTQNFLEIKNPDRRQILAFRAAGEDYLHKLMIRKDVYVCPFIGLIDFLNMRTGCLLHHEGSPHPKIREFEAPQSCSFYGEGICQTYDCLAKQNLSDQTILVPLLESSCDNYDFLTYGKLAGNHNMLGLLAEISQREFISLNQLICSVSSLLDNTAIPVTSFEMPLSFAYYSNEELWGVLGTLLENTGYLFDSFEITSSGYDLGRTIVSRMQNHAGKSG